MPHVKIEANIYFDDRCKFNPYYVNIMRRGQTLYQKFQSLDEARDAKEAFIKKHSLNATSHPLVFEQDGKYIIEVTIAKEYSSLEEATKRADILLKFIDKP